MGNGVGETTAEITGTAAGTAPGETPADESRRAIMTATVELCRNKGYAGLDVGEVAAAAGTTREEIEARWPSKGALVITAFRGLLARDLGYADSGDFRADLKAQLVGMARVLADPKFGPFLAEIVAEAQADEATDQAFLQHVFEPNRALALERFAKAQRDGQVRADVDLDVAIDLTFAPLWFRFLLPTGPLTADYAERVADEVLTGIAPTS